MDGWMDDKRVYLSPWHLVGMDHLLGPLMIRVCIVLLCNGEFLRHWGLGGGRRRRHSEKE